MADQQTFSNVQPIKQSFTDVQPITASATPPNEFRNAEPRGFLESAQKWAENVGNDIKNGTDITGVGGVLKAMGAHGVYKGNSQAVGDFMASLPLGLAKVAQGAAEIPQSGKTWQGTKDVVGGALQAATIPASFVAPEAAEVAAGVPGKVVAGIASKIPSTERAGKLFQEVSQVAGQHTVPVTNGLSDALTQYQQLVDAGGSQSLSVRKLINRITDPDKPPLTYDEARLFASNISRLSADEAMRLAPVMKRAVGSIASNFNSAIADTAQNAGQLDKYQGAMKGYRQAMQLKDAKEAVKDAAIGAVKYGVGAGAGGYLVKKGIDLATGK